MFCLWWFLSFSRSVISNSLRPHGLQHARFPCPLPSPRVFSNSCPLSRWCLPTILSSVVPLSSCLQSLPASQSFLKSWFFSSGGQNFGASASASVLPVNIQDWFPLGLTGLISLQSKGLSRAFSNTTVQKHHFFGIPLSLWPNSHPHMTIGKTIALARQTFVGKVMFLLFNMLSRFVVAFLPRSKVKVKAAQLCPTLCDPMDCPWNSPGQNTGVGSLCLGTQGLNPGLPYCGWILYQLNHKGSPRTLEWVACPFSRGSSQPRNWTRVSHIAGRNFSNWEFREALPRSKHLLISKKKACFNFIAAVTMYSDFGAQENKVCHCFHCFPHLFAMKGWDQMP